MPPPFSRLGLIGATLLAVVAGGCRREGATSPTAAVRAVVVAPGPQASPEPVGLSWGERKPWVTHVQATDLDRDGVSDFVVCEGRRNEVSWLRLADRPEAWQETVLVRDLPAPVRTCVVDEDGDGDLDLWVASMGVIFPSNERVGALYWLENRGTEGWQKHLVEEHLARVTDVQSVDLNGDGLRDLAVAQFGYDQGEVRWLERTREGGWRSHPLIDRSGAINLVVADFNGDGHPDLATVLAQQWEEVWVWLNDGRGHFTGRVVFASANEDFGSSGLVGTDLNGDGRTDLLLSNGDGFDYAEPGSRPWHGVQWLENLGSGQFRLQRVGDLPGAYAPVVVDWNRDGRLDVLAVSGFNEWERPGAASFVAFLQSEEGRFAPQVLATAPTHLLTVAVAAQAGEPVLVTGGFHAYPPYDRMSRLTWWRIQPKEAR